MNQNTNPLDVSPREAWLEREYARLKAEVEHLRRIAVPRFSMTEPPEDMMVAANTRTLQVAATVRAERTRYDGLHVYLRSDTREFGQVNLSYAVSAFDLYSSRNAAAVMVEMHKRVVFDLGKHLWNNS